MSRLETLRASVRRGIVGYWHHRFATMFALLLAVIGLHPLLAALAATSRRPVLHAGLVTLDVVLALALVVGILGLVREHVRPALLGMGAVALLGRVAGHLTGRAEIEATGEGAFVLACVLGIVASARRAFRPGPVDRERLFAALDAYLLTGLALAAAYWAIEVAWPASFGGPLTVDLTRPAAIYFSFVTLATLGYGDIVPATDVTRGLAVLEAVAGQVYLAVLVARLVSLYGRDDGGPPSS